MQAPSSHGTGCPPAQGSNGRRNPSPRPTCGPARAGPVEGQTPGSAPVTLRTEWNQALGITPCLAKLMYAAPLAGPGAAFAGRICAPATGPFVPMAGPREVAKERQRAAKGRPTFAENYFGVEWSGSSMRSLFLVSLAALSTLAQAANFLSVHQLPHPIALPPAAGTFQYTFDTKVGFKEQYAPTGVAGCSIGFGTGGCAFPGGGSPPARVHGGPTAAAQGVQDFHPRRHALAAALGVCPPAHPIGLCAAVWQGACARGPAERSRIPGRQDG